MQTGGLTFPWSSETAVLYADGAIVIALLCLWVYCLLDVLTTRASAMRNLPKVGWLVVVFLGGFGLGPLLWLLFGRPRGAARRAVPRPPLARPTMLAPDDDEDFLRSLRSRAEEQRRRAAEDDPRS